MQERLDARDLRACLAVAAVGGLFYAVGMGEGSHYNSDDVLYAQMAREMLASGDFVDNRWLGVVHFEKPPLLLWALALSASLFGFGEAALRLPITLFSVAGLIAFFVLARGLGLARRPALTATGLLAGSTFYLLMTRRLMTDIPLLTSALGCAALMLRGRGAASGAFAGLALLAKGPAAAPLLAAIYMYGIAARTLGTRGLLLAFAALLVVAAPWHAAVTLRHGAEFWSGYLGHHLVSRVSHGVVPGLSLPELAGVLARERVLLALAVIGLAAALWQRLARPAQRFACLWLFASALPLLASGTRLPHYLLPLTPGLALLAVSNVPARWWQHRLAALAAIATVLAALVADPDKLAWWLDPDFGRNEQRIAHAIARAAGPEDVAIAFNFTNPALVFYSGGRGVSMYADDPRFVEVHRGVLMIQRQGREPGGLHDLRAEPLPDPGTGHQFVVARAVDAARVASLLRDRARGAMYRLVAGDLVLLNDARIGEPLEPRSAR